MAFLASGGPAVAGLFSDPDPNWQESEATYPPPFTEASLRQFFVSAASPNQFMLDETSLSIGADGVVRYVLVVRTQGGAENVTFEGIRCATWERRIYAMARPGGEWSPARRSGWEPIGRGSYNRPSAVLAHAYFCDGPAPPRDRDEVLRKLREKPRIDP